MSEIGEAEARGETARLYDDIRRCTGAGMVNLIYRRMAARPGVLPWAWGALRPSFLSGAVERERAAPRAGLDDGGAPPPPPREALAAAGLGAADLRAIRATVDAYNRANLGNLAAIGALAAFLADGGAARPPRPADAPPAPPAPPLLPPIPDMAALPAATADLVRLLAARAAPPDTPIIPSLYRHLAPWPAFLALAAASALALDRAAVAARAAALHARARPAMARLARAMAPREGTAPPPEDELRALADLAARFSAGPIAGMAALGHRMRAALPD